MFREYDVRGVIGKEASSLCLRFTAHIQYRLKESMSVKII
jgi:hypothetical protein